MFTTLAPESVSILDDFRRIVHVLYESTRVSEQRLGVTVAQLFVLRSLAESPGQSLTRLAARTHAHQRTVSGVVKRLVSAGLVQRSTALNDARCLHLQLTKRGEHLLERAPLAIVQDRLIEGIEHMPRLRRRRLAHTLRALIQEMHLDEEFPVMFFENEGTTPEVASDRWRGGRGGSAV